MNNRIRDVRKSISLNQDDFAKKLGLTKNYISLVETGQRNLSEQSIKVLCTEFNINEEWLRTGEGEMYDIPVDDLALVVSDLIEKSDPVYDIIVDILKTYGTLDDKSKSVIQNFILQVADATKSREKN